MPSWLPHIIVPALVALLLIPMPRRRILAWAPLAWAPDVDYAIQSTHRALTHSLLIPLLLVAILLVLWRRRDPEASLVEYATRPGASGNLLLAAFFVLGHDLMDIFAGGVVLFWPVSNLNLYVGFEVLLDTGNNTFTPSGEAGASEGVPTLSPIYPWVSTVDTAILGFLGATGLGWWIARTMRRPVPKVHVRRQAVATPVGLQGDAGSADAATKAKRRKP